MDGHFLLIGLDTHGFIQGEEKETLTHTHTNRQTDRRGKLIVLSS